MVKCPNCGHTGCVPGQAMCPECYEMLPDFGPEPGLVQPTGRDDPPHSTGPNPGPVPDPPPLWGDATPATPIPSMPVASTFKCPSCGHAGCVPGQAICPICFENLADFGLKVDPVDLGREVVCGDPPWVFKDSTRGTTVHIPKESNSVVQLPPDGLPSTLRVPTIPPDHKPKPPIVESTPERREPSLTLGISCPKCKAINPREGQFCEECGEGLLPACPGCGVPHRVEAKFCPKCGAKLGATGSTPVSTPLTTAPIAPRTFNQPSASNPSIPPSPPSPANGQQAIPPKSTGSCMAYLVLYDAGGHETGRFRLKEGENTIGVNEPAWNHYPDVDLRDLDAQVVVSRKHARLRLERGAMVLEDASSSNSTYVDESRLTPNTPATVTEHSRLRFANLSGKIVLA